MIESLEREIFSLVPLSSKKGGENMAINQLKDIEVNKSKKGSLKNQVVDELDVQSLHYKVRPGIATLNADIFSHFYEGTHFQQIHYIFERVIHARHWCTPLKGGVITFNGGKIEIFHIMYVHCRSWCNGYSNKRWAR